MELICTLALIAILSAIANPKFMDFQDRSSDLTIKKAVNQLNVQVRVLFKKNRLDEESTNSYYGYTGYLRPDVMVTGQAPNTPLSGTIRLVSDSKTYEIIWIPGAKDDTKSPGHFKLGQKL